ncbi:MAG: hypothetical protein NDJ89_14000 [Oligoflexia bacterium]|nr:hypothetical protein [Oligoflexia bacterium]
MKDHESPSPEVRLAEQEAELSNRNLSLALDKLKHRVDHTLARLRHVQGRLIRASHPIERASEQASRSRVFAWSGVGAIGLLSGFGVKKIWQLYDRRAARRISSR